MPSDDSSSYARTSVSHCARRDKLRKAVDLATQLEDTLRGVGPRNTTRSCRAKNDMEQAELDEICGLEDMLDQKVRDATAMGNEVLSPTSRLNDDALRLVFHEICKVEELTTLSPLPRTRNVLVSHVCRRWRDLALETPALWAAATFKVRPQPQQTPRSLDPAPDEDYVPAVANLNVLHTFLHRAKNSPLNVALNLTNDASPAMDFFLEKCRDHRVVECLSVAFRTTDHPKLMSCFSSIHLELKALHVTHVKAGAAAVLSIEELEELLRLPMPSLQQLTLCGMTLPPVFKSSYVGLSTVQRLILAGINSTFTLPMVRTAVHCCPDLESLTLWENRDYMESLYTQPDDPMQGHVSEPKLKSLNVQLCQLCPHVFNALIAPQLTTLVLVFLDPVVLASGTVITMDASIDACADALCSFLDISAPSLRSLSLAGLHSRHCEQILRRTPTITQVSYTLAMYIEPTTNNGEPEVASLWTALVPSEPAERVCPALQRIVYQGVYGTQLLRLFLQLVRERSQHLHALPIQTLRLDKLPDVLSEEVRALLVQIGEAIEEFDVDEWKYSRAEGRWMRKIGSEVPKRRRRM